MVLFIFETKKAQKILLKIERKPSTACDFDVGYLLKYVQKIDNISIPKSGNIVEIGKCDDLRVFIWKFKNCVACSKATHKDFRMVKQSQKKIEGMPNSKGRISYPYFTLKLNQDLSEDDTYPSPEFERIRVDMFSTSLQLHGYVVHQCGAAGSYCFCEFSGGGDFYVAGQVAEPLVFQCMQNADDDDNPRAANNLSPPTGGTQRFATLSIEGKVGSSNIKSVIYQLWANMIVITVDKFVQFCLGYGNGFTKTDLINILSLTAYGIACFGDGSVAAYKLEISFNNCNSITEKVEPSNYNKTVAARLIDSMLEYYRSPG